MNLWEKIYSSNETTLSNWSVLLSLQFYRVYLFEFSYYLLLFIKTIRAVLRRKRSPIVHAT
jgi:hypothetical protein